MSHFEVKMKDLPRLPMRMDYVEKKVKQKRDDRKQVQKLSELELYKIYMAKRMQPNYAK